MVFGIITSRPMIGVYQLVWVALLLVVGSDGRWSKLTNASNRLTAIDNQLGRQFLPAPNDLAVNPDTGGAKCPCCDNNCSWNSELALLTCSNILSFKDYPENCSRLIERLEIVNPRFRLTSLAALPPLPSLHRLSIVGSIHLVRVDYLPPSLQLLTHLSITNNSRLSHFDSNLWQLLQTAHNLTYLNLAYNRLNSIDGDYLPIFQKLSVLYLSGWCMNN